jgi:hypothetical protein
VRRSAAANPRLGSGPVDTLQAAASMKGYRVISRDSLSCTEQSRASGGSSVAPYLEEVWQEGWLVCWVSTKQGKPPEAELQVNGPQQWHLQLCSPPCRKVVSSLRLSALASKQWHSTASCTSTASTGHAHLHPRGEVGMAWKATKEGRGLSKMLVSRCHHLQHWDHLCKRHRIAMCEPASAAEALRRCGTLPPPAGAAAGGGAGTGASARFCITLPSAPPVLLLLRRCKGVACYLCNLVWR